MWDCVVIGSGVGGLVSAAALSRAGQRVLVLERHALPGGYATSFRRRGAEFEVSLHLLGDMAEGGAVRGMLDELGVTDRVRFLEAGTLYRACFPDGDVTASRGVEGYRAVLIGRFPEEAAGLDRLFERCLATRREILDITARHNRGEWVDLPRDAPTVMQLVDMTWGELCSEHVRSLELKAILSQFWMYFGLPPSQVSAVYFAYVWTEYHHFGGWYPVGRSQTLSNALRDIVRAHGGEIRLRQEVVEILVEECRAVGVRTGTGEVHRAKNVISNADPWQTFERLVGREHVPPRYLRKIAGLVPSLSSVQLFLLLKGNFAARYGEQAHELFVNESYDLERGYRETLAGQYDTAPYCLTIFENLNEAYQKQPGRSTLSMMLLCDPAPWLALDEPSYRLEKERVERALLDRLERRYPRLGDTILHAELSTPHTNRRYTLNRGGAIYGAAPTVKQALHRRLSQKTPVGGLWLVGAWTQPGGGYSGCIWSGYNLARRLLAEAAT